MKTSSSHGGSISSDSFAAYSRPGSSPIAESTSRGFSLHRPTARAHLLNVLITSYRADPRSIPNFNEERSFFACVPPSSVRPPARGLFHRRRPRRRGTSSGIFLWQCGSQTKCSCHPHFARCPPPQFGQPSVAQTRSSHPFPFNSQPNQITQSSASPSPERSIGLVRIL